LRLADPLAGYARRSRLASGQNSRAIIAEFILARFLRRGCELLERGQAGVAAHAIGAHTDCQPSRVAGKDGPETERGGEQAVGHADGQIGDGAADLAAAAGRVGQGELKVVQPAGWAAAVLELARLVNAVAWAEAVENWALKVEIASKARAMDLNLDLNLVSMIRS
jgi:hypothetical protein